MLGKRRFSEPESSLKNNFLCWLRMVARHIPDRRLRHLIYRWWLVGRMGEFVRIGMDVEIRFPHNIEIVDNVQINDGVLFMNHGKIVIEDGALIGPGSQFLTVSHDYRKAFSDPANSLVPCWKKGNPEFLPIVIERDVWVGANVVVMPGITIGHHTVVAAGSVVTEDVEPYSVVGGAPARLIHIINRGESHWE